jgi:hypothetical protein
MKILTYVAENESKAKTGVILRKLEQLVRDFHYLLPNGWRFILKMQTAEMTEPYYHIDVQSNNGGGSFAEVKMAMLESQQDMAASGEIDIKRLIDMLNNSPDDMSEDKKLIKRSIINELIKLSEVSQISKEAWRMIRDHFNITGYHGAVRVPYEDLEVEDDSINYESGEIRISFSGASQEQDILFALWVLKTLNTSFPQLYPNTQGWLNLRKLEKIPAVKLWLDLLEINEA